MKKIFFLLLITLATVSSAQTTAVPFSRGVNLSSWFQESSAKQIQFSKYTKTDFKNIKLLGCDVIRLPINMHSMTSGAPDYTVDPLLFEFLDQAVDWAEELNLHILLDNHSFDPAVNTSPSVLSILVPVWKQVAEHMKLRSNLVYYEILNEPHGINDVVWNAIQKNVIDSIRTIDNFHTIIIGPAGWNGFSNLNQMPIYADTNLIYTFHFYDPFIFTHQGASWANPSLVPLSGVPFPYNAATMPALPQALVGTYIQNEFNNYSNSGTAASVKNLIDIAVNFRNGRNVRIFCGEFGVYIPNSNNQDRVNWYELMRKYFEEKGIAWTIWDYQGGFGLFEKYSDELFDYDLNIPLVNALGLNTPPQKEFSILPDTVKFDLYNDYIGPNIVQSSYSSGNNLDFYSSDSHVEGKYCIRWSNAALYDHIGFDFKPTKDLSVLKNKNYALSFWICSSSPGLQFDVRFIDTKSSTLDHPWRIRKTITSSVTPLDGVWHQVRIPLSNFTEHGSWDNAWYNPEGKFDWSAIDRFEFAAELIALTGKELWLDNIQIVSMDPAYVDGSSILPTEFKLLQNYPNPFNPITTFQYQLPRNSYVTLQIYNVIGQVVETLVDQRKVAGTHQVQWSTNISGGVYFYRLQADDVVQTRKLLLLK